MTNYFLRLSKNAEKLKVLDMLIYEKSTPHKVGILLFYFNE